MQEGDNRTAMTHIRGRVMEAGGRATQRRVANSKGIQTHGEKMLRGGREFEKKDIN